MTIRKRTTWSRLKPWVRVAILTIPLKVAVLWWAIPTISNWQEATVEKKVVACDDVGTLFGYEEVKYLHGQCYGLLDGKAVVVL